jgi:hypothetical protein
MRPMWRLLVILYLLAVALNYPWELLQAPLFTPVSHIGKVWLHCFISSLGDGLMVLLLFALGWLSSRDRHWFIRPGLSGHAVLLTSGALLAMLVEWVAVHLIHRWAYAETMPRIPLLDIGFVPILQMILLPPIVFLLLRRWAKERGLNPQTRRAT